MKLGIIADVHGDSVALGKALALLYAQGVDQIVCAGDLADICADAEGVIDQLQARNIPCVQGNHDRSAADDGFAYVNTNQRYGIEAMYSHDLSPATCATLKALPFALKFEWEGKRIHMTHANTWDLDTPLFVDSAVERFRRVADEAEADMIIVGHTHIPMSVTIGGCVIINPGRTYYGWPEQQSTCAILTLPECDFRVLDVDSGADVPFPRVNL